MKRAVPWLLSLLAGTAALAVVAATVPAEKQDPWLRPAAVPSPADNKPNAARVELGKMLFFDPRLSGAETHSCFSCHNPALGWSDGQPTAIGHGFQRLQRNSPTILNTAYQPLHMWDGRKKGLEDQALGPIEAAGEMNQPLDQLVVKLNAIKGYRPLFDKAYPNQGITLDTIAKAIASFERTIVSTEAPFDRWRRGDEKAVDASVKRGFALFQGKADCVGCHTGFNFTDNSFYNIGVSAVFDDHDGRFAHRKDPVMKGAFKTPTLRDIALTAPYMHNGIYKTLEEVVDHYDRGGDVKDNLSDKMKPLGLTSQEKKDLVAFMRSLTGAPRQVVPPVLPQN
jgi:cytochrome c peroxidase